jgi:hypothetical protein
MGALEPEIKDILLHSSLTLKGGRSSADTVAHGNDVRTSVCQATSPCHADQCRDEKNRVIPDGYQFPPQSQYQMALKRHGLFRCYEAI